MGGIIGAPRTVETGKSRVGFIPVLGALIALGLAGFVSVSAESLRSEPTDRPMTQLLVLANQATTPSRNVDQERLNPAPTLVPLELLDPLQLEPTTNPHDSIAANTPAATVTPVTTTPVTTTPVTTTPVAVTPAANSPGSAAEPKTQQAASVTESSPPQTDPVVSQSPTTSVAPSTIANNPETVGDSALRLIAYPWQERLPGWTISFLPGRSGLYGLTLTTEKRIEIYVRDDQSNQLLAHVIAHELGHAVDVSLNDGPDRRRWQEARGIGSVPWWPGNGATDFSTGAGDFAESFAAWQVGSTSFRSKVAGPPTAEQQTLLADLSGV